MNTERKRKYKKNGSIELMRFVFSAAIILFHISRDLWGNRKFIGYLGNTELYFFRNGYIGVEFFFLVSGFWMAKSIYRSIKNPREEDIPIGEETILFLWRKVRQIMIFYLPASLIVLCIQFWERKVSVLRIASRLPSLLFLQRAGAFPHAFISVAWYISSMLIAMAVIYPLCKKFYGTYTTLVAPLSGLLLIGMIVHNTGTLAGASEWMGIIYKSNVRAIAEIGIGTTCFEVSRRIEGKLFSVRKQILFSGIAILCYGLTIVFAMSHVPESYSAGCFYLLCIAITISFSGIGWLSQKDVFQKKFFMYLGTISLPMYLLQNVFRKMIPLTMGGYLPKYQCLGIFAGTLTGAIVMNEIVDRMKKTI